MRYEAQRFGKPGLLEPKIAAQLIGGLQEVPGTWRILTFRDGTRAVGVSISKSVNNCAVVMSGNQRRSVFKTFVARNTNLLSSNTRGTKKEGLGVVDEATSPGQPCNCRDSWPRPLRFIPCQQNHCTTPYEPSL